MMELELASCVDIGIKETNDDRVLVLNVLQSEGIQGGCASVPALAVVCDGCGGYDGGFLAAETVLETLGEAPAAELLDPEKLQGVLESCREAVFRKKRIYSDYEEMCTTVAGCVFGEDRTVVFHAGDSRVYRCDRYGLARMTIDHSAVQEMIDCGRITPEEALTHPNRNIITRALGVESLGPEIYVSNCAIEPGETFLLCSDGLWEYITEGELQEMLSADLPLERIAGDLVALALDRGSNDNVSACLCRRPGGEPAEPPAVTKAFVLD